MKLEKALEKLEELLSDWGLSANDWVLWGEYAMQLFGYNIPISRDGHLDIAFDKKKLFWKIQKNAESAIPPLKTKELAELKIFIKKTKFSPHLLPLSYHNFNITEARQNSVIYILPNKRKIRVKTPVFDTLWRAKLLSRNKIISTWDKDRIERWLDYFLKLKAIAKEKKDKKMIEVCDRAIRKCRKIKGKEARKKIVFSKKIKKISGKAVFKTRKKIKGTVKIIKNIRDIKKLKKGNILVAKMTLPDFIVEIEKSSAIITDIGGTLCHAAIISRELKIPCIIGTKVATKVLKDGDLVEVDAQKGEVKILKRVDRIF